MTFSVSSLLKRSSFLKKLNFALFLLQGFVVGCITGNCRFYQILDNDVIMDEQILIRGRNRITAVEFCPGSSEKILVSSEDSKVRIFDKTQMIHKFKGIKKNL